MGQFDNKVAIVTGSGGGIGAAYAQGLAADGAAVVIADINSEAGEGVAKQIVADLGSFNTLELNRFDDVFRIDIVRHGKYHADTIGL